MSNVYDALLRHPMLLTSNTTILGNEAQLSGPWLEHVKTHNIKISTTDWLTAQAYREHISDDDIAFGPTDVSTLKDKVVILLWPKSKVEGLTLLTMLASVATSCYVVAANDAGGKSIKSATKEIANDCTKIDSARHCGFWSLDFKPTDVAPNWLKYARSFTADERSFLTLPGVFGHGKLDKGTALLLENIPAPAHGRILDLGCGSGVIGLTMKVRNPKLDVILTDVDALALRSAELNSVRLGQTVEILASDGLEDVSGRFDYIFSNPPFHQGKRTDYDFALRLFRDARRQLTRDGQVWIVANRHLGYEEWAAESFNKVDVMVQAHGFKLLCVSHPK